VDIEENIDTIPACVGGLRFIVDWKMKEFIELPVPGEFLVPAEVKAILCTDVDRHLKHRRVGIMFVEVEWDTGRRRREARDLMFSVGHPLADKRCAASLTVAEHRIIEAMSLYLK
jgi:hypothetical protein